MFRHLTDEEKVWGLTSLKDYCFCLCWKINFKNPVMNIFTQKTCQNASGSSTDSLVSCSGGRWWVLGIMWN